MKLQTRQPSKPLLSNVAILVIGAVGALAAMWLGMPAPLLIGPAVLVTIATLMGMNAPMNALLRNIVFAVIGTVMGAGVTPEVLETAAAWPASFLLLGVSLVVIMAACTALLRFGFGHAHHSAVLAATPGHLSFVLGLGAETGGNMAAIGIIQSVRLLCLTIAVPFLLVELGYQNFTPGQASAGDMSLPVLTLMLVLAWGAGWFLSRLRLPAAYLIAALTLSTAAHISGLVEGNVPIWLSTPAFVYMGTLIGARFSGVSLRELRRYLIAGFAVTLLSLSIAIAFGLISAHWTGLPNAQVQIAYVPGGVETMAALAVVMDIDPTYVAAHHVMRLFILTGLLPLFLGLGRWGRKTSQ